MQSPQSALCQIRIWKTPARGRQQPCQCYQKCNKGVGYLKHDRRTEVIDAWKNHLADERDKIPKKLFFFAYTSNVFRFVITSTYVCSSTNRFLSYQKIQHTKNANSKASHALLRVPSTHRRHQ